MWVILKHFFILLGRRFFSYHLEWLNTGSANLELGLGADGFGFDV